METISLRNSIIKKSTELGFVDIGFAKAEPLSQEIEVYKKWISENNNATMAWMERNIELREDIRKLHDDAKSVIMFAYNYYTNHHYSDDGGKISRYAWGTDYHDIILPKLKEIASLIENEDPDSNNRCFVDTGPVLEKIWAEKAGIGWMGKNSLIINKKYGSWIFLGTIITDLMFEYDMPHKNLCGKCTACIDSCPSNAIVSNKIVDSKKCLSYWTIEAKADIDIPKEIGEKANDWIFGCDSCQDVCPWNKKAVLTDEELFEPRENQTNLSAEYVLNMQQEAFSKRFRKSPIKRTKLNGLKRNIVQILLD